jgi:predicted outer membrane repeat protein
MKTKSLLFALVFVFAMTANATTYYVRSTGGLDTNDGLSSGTPFLTLNKAFDLPALADGDVIDISGTFTYATSKNLTKSITIQGTDKSTAIVEGVSGAIKNCFIFGGVDAGTGLPTSTPNITIENVTFQNFDNLNAAGTAGNGGAFFVQVGVTLTCRNVNFINNQAYSGGAIRAFGGVLTFEDCLFQNNRAKRIGGLYSDGGVFNIQLAANMGSPAVPNTNNLTLLIDRCLFEGNTSDRYGSALSLVTQISGSVVPSLLVQNCTFTGNEVTALGDLNSGTIYIQESTQNAEVTLINNTIAYNSSKISTLNATAGIYILNTSSANKVNLINNIIFSNFNAESTPKSVAIKTGQTLPLTESRNNIIDYNFNFTTNTSTDMSSGNISSVTSEQLLLAETLANNGGATNTLSLGAGSVAVNAGYEIGVPSVDQRNTARIGTPDVGAYEFGFTTQIIDTKDLFQIYSVNQSVVIRGIAVGESILVYSISGNLILKQKAVNNEISFKLPKGVYLVRALNTVKKVVVD